MGGERIISTQLRTDVRIMLILFVSDNFLGLSLYL